MEKKFGFILLFLMVFSFGIVSADTPITGVIYNTTIGGDNVTGANVNVTCDGILKSTISESDGVYGVSFLSSECNNSSNYIVSAEKGDYSGSDGANDVSDLFGAVMNIAIEKKEVVESIIIFNGTVYNTTLNGTVVEGANVSVTCDGIPKMNISNVNGSYSVEFLESECNSSHIFSVFAIKGEYNGTSENLNVSNGTVVDVVITKPIIEIIPTCSDGIQNGRETGIDCGGNCGSCGGSSKKESSGSGGWVKPNCRDGYHFNLENGVGKCVVDAVIVQNETSNETGFSLAGDNETATPKKGFISLMTGAVIGGGVGSWTVIAILIALVLLAFFFMWRRKRNNEDTPDSKKNSKK